MNTITANMDGPKNYWPNCLSETPLITKFQKDKLTALIYSHIDDPNECELRLCELEELTKADADYYLYQFDSGIWS